MTAIVTRIATMFNGNLVGTDELGNKYYCDRRSRKAPGSAIKQRRWVLYSGQADPSRIAPEWHAWLHHVVEAAPDPSSLVKHSWQKPHQPNMTGTVHAYPPSDTTANAAKPDTYRPWSPDN